MHAWLLPDGAAQIRMVRTQSLASPCILSLCLPDRVVCLLACLFARVGAKETSHTGHVGRNVAIIGHRTNGRERKEDILYQSMIVIGSLCVKCSCPATVRVPLLDVNL
jgi:hypothetical protein